MRTNSVGDGSWATGYWQLYEYRQEWLLKALDEKNWRRTTQYRKLLEYDRLCLKCSFVVNLGVERSINPDGLLSIVCLIVYLLYASPNYTHTHTNIQITFVSLTLSKPAIKSFIVRICLNRFQKAAWHPWRLREFANFLTSV